MKFTTEFLVVVAAMVLFYFRIAQLRGQKKRMEREFALKRRKVGGRSKGMVLPSKAPGTPPFGVKSWLLVGLSILIMLGGFVMYSNMQIFGVELVKNEELITALAKYWYIAVSAGILLLAFCIKIDKPKLEE